MKKLFVILLAVVLGTLLLTGTSPKQKTGDPEVTVPLRFDYYYSYEMVCEALEKLHKAYPQLTRLDLVGKSDEGRAIYALTINNPKTGNENDKPGIYADGNIHGNEIQASEVCLYLADYLLKNYGVIDEITKLVDKKSFYIIPSVNVDGRYHFFHDGQHSSSGRTIYVPVDDDRDGLIDEDPFDDLDGDGNICRMRKKDPNGSFIVDPDDPRIMKSVEPGKKGDYIMLGFEGIDNDGDGRINEDVPGYVDGNRNFGFDWQPPYVQNGAGEYPFQGVGLKAIAEYVMKHPNICMAWTFHNTGGMYLRGPSSKLLGEYPISDVQVYDYIGKQAERITPGYRYLLSWKDLYTTYGDSGEFMANLAGCFSLVGELSITKDESFKTFAENQKEAIDSAKKGGEDEEDFDFMRYSDLEKEHLKYQDNLAQGELFVDWHPYKHPVYGDIEIGGWVKYSQRMPPAFMIKDMVHRNASAVIFSAKQTPEVSMEVFETKKIGDDLYRIRVRLGNANAIPTMTALAEKQNLYPKDMLKVSGKNIRVIAGGVLRDKYTDQVSYKDKRPEVQFLLIYGFSTFEYQFLVSGSGSVSFDYSSRHAGKITRTIQLQ